MTDKKHIAFIWQRFLPYHLSRLKYTISFLSSRSISVSAIEVASQDSTYGFPTLPEWKGVAQICCFPDINYHDLNSKAVHAKVLAVLAAIKPDVVFAPATPFPEGMAAYHYRMRYDKKAVMMDDAWEVTDRRGTLTRNIKRLIHQNIDAAFIPAPSHQRYFMDLGFPPARIIYGVDVVDNSYFSQKANEARNRARDLHAVKRLPAKYFLFVGRFMERKGLDTLIAAYKTYRAASFAPWDLILVGSGRDLANYSKLSASVPGLRVDGPQFGDDLCHYYALAKALVVPSISDPWGLVVNEAMASGLPVIASKGCGAAHTLIKEGENGWTINPGDARELSNAMLRMSPLPDEQLKKMGDVSRNIIADWSLDRFIDGINAAVAIPRRPPAGVLANIATSLWKGRKSIN